jgi:hypothetical protein
MGRITASFNESFAASNPATSSHLTFGVSVRIAPVSEHHSITESEYNERETNWTSRIEASSYQYRRRHLLPSWLHPSVTAQAYKAHSLFGRAISIR